MNKETFAKYIGDLSLLDNDTLPEIKTMLDEFPYFQSAWVLYIKNLHTIKDIRYENKLKTACAFVSDRKLLHDILKGTYIPTNRPTDEQADSLVQTQFVAATEENKEIEPIPVEPQNIVDQDETAECIPAQTQSFAPTPEIEEIEDSPIEPQNIVAQDEIPESVPVQTQFIAPTPESEEIEESPVEPQNIVAQDETTESTPAQTQFTAPQPEPQEEANPEIQQSDHSATITEQDSEEYSNPRTFSSAKPILESSNQEPSAPLSIADRILMQMEEMRRAKESAASAENEKSESHVETQNLASQDKNEITEIDVETQNFASQEEGIPIPTQEEPREDSTSVQEQSIETTSEIQEPEESPVETQNIASQDENTQTEGEESSNFETNQPETEEQETRNIETESSYQPQKQSPISQQQIKEAIEKQLLSLGINANITFTNGSANIQFENFDVNAKKEASSKEENIVEPIVEASKTAEKTHVEKPAITSNKRKKMDLIDQFLVSEAKIVPIKNYHSDSTLSTESLIEDEELFSEKLAKIYIKQGHLEKALTTYEKLYLKYPEKSIYFATQIEYVKRLINK